MWLQNCAGESKSAHPLLIHIHTIMDALSLMVTCLSPCRDPCLVWFVDEPSSLTNVFGVFSLYVCGMWVMYQAWYVRDMNAYLTKDTCGGTGFAVTGAIKYVCWYVSGYVLEFFTHEFHSELWVLRGCRLPGIQWSGLRWSHKSRELSVKVRGVLEG